jgi:hypothetical protein
MPAKSKYTEQDLPAPGSLFFVPLQDGRFSIVRVARRRTAVDPTESTPSKQVIAAMVLVVSSPWVGDEAKRPPDADIRRILAVSHHSWKGKPELRWICEPPPAHFPFAGNLELTAQDEALDSVAYGDWETLDLQPLLQWRWDHDRERLLQEEAEERQKVIERSRAFAAKQAEILRTTTLDSLLQRQWFEQWDLESEAAARDASRRLVAGFVQALHASPKPTKAVVRRHLRACVEAFNRLEAESPFIQTTHAEDIDEALAIIVTVVRHADLADAIDEWRDW